MLRSTYLNTSVSSYLKKSQKVYLIIGLYVSDQDGEILDPEVDIVVDKLVDTLICGSWIPK